MQIPRRTLIDGALVLTCLVLTLLAIKTPWSPLPWPVVAAAGLLGSAAMWPRRRRPMLSAVAGAVAFALAGNPGPLFIGVYSGARYAPRLNAWLCGIAGWVGFVTWSWFDSGQLTIDNIVFPPLGIALIVLAGINQATRDALLASLQEQARAADEQARAAERTRIAREMHDVLAHKMSLIALYAGALELRATDDPKLRDGTVLIRTTAREALVELREVLGVLRTDDTTEQFADLTALVAASTRAGHPVELHDDAGDLPAATARVVYRVVQEGLTNAHKHAPAALTTVSVGRTDDGSVAVAVHNRTGNTAMDLPGSGAGLVGLAERIRLVGGSLRSGPTAGAGWQLSAVVPWLDPRPEAT
ncbi:histidine kinase [Actinoplanes sichuanensis]|uniref:histidine kinase n=1 Tax=Actinoplanes sichuanensis TaxID=512349 RepID=A0ABW4AVG9_9ACTN|nr:histidine kinase [Actinoplanes sichuanensis]BEL04491.1 histidine kinase [Actinoplanes sichuanensis]